jgi:hypothetical protein
MAFLTGWLEWSLSFAFWKVDVALVASPASIKKIALRWIHIVSAIIWLDFLYFFGLAVAPALKTFEPTIRVKLFPEVASLGLAGLAGFRWSVILAKTHAVNAGRPHAQGGWIGIWAV